MKGSPELLAVVLILAAVFIPLEVLAALVVFMFAGLACLIVALRYLRNRTYPRSVMFVP